MYLSNSFDNDIKIYIIQMNQTNITNSSIILIKFTQEEKDYCLGNDSFISNLCIIKEANYTSRWILQIRTFRTFSSLFKPRGKPMRT